MDRTYFPIYKYCNCGESFIVKRKVDRTYIEHQKGMFLEYGNKLHDCKGNLPTNIDDFKDNKMYIKYDIIGCILNKESEDNEDEIRDGAINNRDQKDNGETNIDKQS